MKEIKNIIFDLGGVILNIDYLLLVSAFKELGFDGFDNWFSQKEQNELFDKLETGNLTSLQFYNEIRKISGKPLTDQEIEKAWNAILLDLPEARVNLLNSINRRYRCFLLSNTNEIHVSGFTKIISAQYGSMDIFNNLFEKIYYSNELGMRKPDKGTFEYVLKENGLKAEETVFIDDSPQHLVGAESAGIRSVYLNKDKTLTDLFDKDYNLIS